MARQASVIIDMLTEDHDRLIALFTAFQGMRDTASEEAKQTLIELACTELVIHAQVEEEHLYPAMVEALDDPFILEQAEVEHAVVRRLIAELETMQAGDRLYDAKFIVLADAMRHHIEEEQSQLFPRMLKLDLAMESLAQDIRFRRAQLRHEFGLSDADTDEDEDDPGFRFHFNRKPHYRHH